MGFVKEFVILFQGLTLGIVLVLLLGLALIIFEMARPSFGISATIGGLLYILGIVMRVSIKDGNALAQIFYMLFFAMIFVLAFFIGSLMTFKKAWLYREHIPLSEELNEGVCVASEDETIQTATLDAEIVEDSCDEESEETAKKERAALITDTVEHTSEIDNEENGDTE